MLDKATVIYNFLTVNGTSLYSLTATRVYSPIPCDASGGGFTNAAATIAFHQASAGAHMTSATHDTVWVFKCYGGTDKPADARTVARALFDRLHGKGGTVSSKTIITARLVAEQYDVMEPDTGYYVAIQQYQIVLEED